MHDYAFFNDNNARKKKKKFEKFDRVKGLVESCDKGSKNGINRLKDGTRKRISISRCNK